MRRFNQKKFKNIYHRLFVYFIEIIIIFIGITISFLFEQWREDNRQKQELIGLAESLIRDAQIGKNHLISDLGGTNKWLRNLDSLRIHRDRKQMNKPELLWFYNLLAGKEFGLFDSKSPAYLSAISSGLLTKLPDTIQIKIYSVYESKLPDLQHLYEQQNETAKHFRNEILIHSNTYLYHSNTQALSIDLEKFALEIQRPIYGNLINQFFTAEMVIRNRNMKITNDFDLVIKSLKNYIEVLKNG
ncbi:MAG: hypothetical protein MUF68_09510 [Cyclobacteriaceae bacterium]|jgi:hypothetical protein|nr:hypothetical protein [Cyclobacteriaceae bacterium]